MPNQLAVRGTAIGAATTDLYNPFSSHDLILGQKMSTVIGPHTAGEKLTNSIISGKWQESFEIRATKHKGIKMSLKGWST